MTKSKSLYDIPDSAVHQTDFADIVVHIDDKSNLFGVKLDSEVRFKVSDIVKSSFGEIITLTPLPFERDLFNK